MTVKELKEHLKLLSDHEEIQIRTIYKGDDIADYVIHGFQKKSNQILVSKK